MSEEGASDVRMGAWRSSHCLHCTVCKTNHDSVDMWLSHLGEAYHQEPARRECFQRWGEDKDLLECVVVLFCSFELAQRNGVMNVLERFSGGVGGDLVTDFVWWPTRPRLAFMQFESRKRVKGIFKELDGPNCHVQDKLVQLKKGVDILELQWNELLPSEGYLQRQVPAVARQPLSKASISSTTEESYGSLVPYPSSCSIPEPLTPLQLQFNSICKSIEIAEEDMTHASQLVKVVTRVFTKEHPSGQVLMFRNYHLGLRTTGNSSNVLLLYAYIADNPSDPDGFAMVGRQTQDSIFTSPDFTGLYPNFCKRTIDACPIGGTPFLQISTGFRLNFITNPLLIAEAHLSLLLRYLCTFDTRVRPLLTLVYFWAFSRDVQISECGVPKKAFYSNSPEPVALEWLVMLFLIREGVVPSVRDILQRPHKPIVLSESREDMGFSCDPDYARQWKESRPKASFTGDTDNLVTSVVSLAQKFFHFYSSNLESGWWLLNPKDGEIRRREEGGPLLSIQNNKLSADEHRVLRGIRRKFASGRSKGVVMSDKRIHMIHPLNVAWRLSFCVDNWTRATCAKMKTTAQALDEYLSWLRVKSEDGQDMTLQQVLVQTAFDSGNALPFPGSSCVPDPRTPLQVEFNVICSSVEIPEEESQQALEILRILEKILRGYQPSGKVVMIRNYYLGLRNTGTNVLCLFLYLPGIPGHSGSFDTIRIALRKQIASDVERHAPGFKSQPLGTCVVAEGYPYQHEVSGFRFNLLTNPLVMPEAQLCRLFQYMCTFDPRVKPLLTLIYFWAKSHSVRIAEESIPSAILPSNCPEPVALEWMVMLFLIRQGAVPSVREILDRPHKPLLINKQKLDIGFSPDPEYAGGWGASRCSPVTPPVNTDQIVTSVVSLARGFFHFYASNLESGSWLLNPKDGEIIRREGTRCHKSKLTSHETGALNIVQGADNESAQHLTISDYRIYMIHPLRVTWKLSFCVETWTDATCAKMKSTAEQLEKYLESLEVKKENGVPFDGPSLEAVLGGTGY